MDVLSELKGLSDASDIVINSGKNHDKRLAEWFKLVRELTTAIYKDEKIITDNEINPESANNTKIPSIVSFITENEKITTKKQRISSALAQMQKHRLSHAKKKVSFEDLKSESRNKTLEQHEAAACNNTFTRSTSCNHAVETPSNSNKRKSSRISHGDRMQDYFTPPQNNRNIPQVRKEEAKTIEMSEQRSKKRKSSPRPLSPIVIVKKVKLIQSKTPKPKTSLRKSLRGQKGKTSESRLPKHISRLPSAKISSTAVNSSVLKENQRPQMKLASDNNQILKKVQADVKKKIQETKIKKEEKLQKTPYLHLKLEKEKQEQLRKHQEKKVEKTLLKTVLDPKKKRTQEVASISDSKVKNGPPSVEEIKANNSAPPIKTPQKKDIKKNIQGDGNENYEMTPVRSSYVNYDISEIKSDDSDDENETETNRKPIPEWATGVRLRNALVQQQYYSINTDELFGNVFETPNLCRIMGEQKKKYLKKRTSSANWNSPSAFK